MTKREAFTRDDEKRRQLTAALPVVLEALEVIKDELESISEERHGIREVFRVHRSDVNQVPIDDPIVGLDLNTPQQYEDARTRYGA